jgi:hypothetical protein
MRTFSSISFAFINLYLATALIWADDIVTVAIVREKSYQDAWAYKAYPTFIIKITALDKTEIKKALGPAWKADFQIAPAKVESVSWFVDFSSSAPHALLLSPESVKGTGAAKYEVFTPITYGDLVASRKIPSLAEKGKFADANTALDILNKALDDIPLDETPQGNIPLALYAGVRLPKQVPVSSLHAVRIDAVHAAVRAGTNHYANPAEINSNATKWLKEVMSVAFENVNNAFAAADDDSQKADDRSRWESTGQASLRRLIDGADNYRVFAANTYLNAKVSKIGEKVGSDAVYVNVAAKASFTEMLERVWTDVHLPSVKSRITKLLEDNAAKDSIARGRAELWKNTMAKGSTEILLNEFSDVIEMLNDVFVKNKGAK